MPCSGPRGALGPPLRVERVGDRERVRIRLDDVAQRGSLAVEGVDAGEVGRGEPARGQGARRHAALQLLDRRLLELEGGRRRTRRRCRARAGGGAAASGPRRQSGRASHRARAAGTPAASLFVSSPAPHRGARGAPRTVYGNAAGGHRPRT